MALARRSRCSRWRRRDQPGYERVIRVGLAHHRDPVAGCQHTPVGSLARLADDGGSSELYLPQPAALILDQQSVSLD
jgi:hypothetical protein